MLYPVYGCDDPNRRADIVFIHGLNPLGNLNGNHAFQTWGMADADSDGWPIWLGRSLGNVGIWLLEYDAAATGWFGDSMSLDDRASYVLGEFYGKRIGERTTFLVAHSLGGLVAKALLYRSITINKPMEAPIGNAIRGVVFFATPHTGSGLASFIDKLPRIFTRQSAALVDLQENSPICRSLSDWYVNVTPDRGIQTLTFFEKQKWNGLFLVVDESSANPNVKGASVFPFDADHIEICKLPKDSMPLSVTERFLGDSLANPT